MMKTFSGQFCRFWRTLAMITFRFLVLIQPLRTCYPLNNNQTQILGHTKITKSLSEDERKRFFTEIFQNFLSEDCDNMLPLSNQALWASLNDTFTTMQAKKTVKSESLNEIINVRKDPSVWDEGIEPTYMRFIKQSPAPTLAACILSIL